MVTQGLISTREDILERAIPLFARLGFHGVSMRDIAAEVEMQAAALYHHFADKEALYLAAMAYAFKDKSVVLTQAIAIPGTPLERLNRFVETLAEGMGRDPDFLALLQRERIDGNETRLKLLAEEVFAEPFDALLTLAKEIAPAHDSHMVAISICALVMYYMETAAMRGFLPGWHTTLDQPKFIAKHAMALLAQLFADGDQK